MKRGKVFLVGAGPGDPELLTLKAVRALGEADVVLYDALVDAAVLAHAHPDARRIHVGKRGGCESTPQAFIERLMVQEALAGRVVVRLKGGDPFVFGRGGEEVRALRAEGIAVEVVPGITSGVAAPARLGVSVTDRDASQGVVFVTGHARDGGKAPDWDALSRCGLTLVVYMGLANARTIADALQRGGLAASTPAAVVHAACTAAERSHVTSLARLADDIERLDFRAPAILVIGDVVRNALQTTELLAAAAL
jgi:uroporphyrin-III C-methyltransferase